MREVSRDIPTLRTRIPSDTGQIASGRNCDHVAVRCAIGYRRGGPASPAALHLACSAAFSSWYLRFGSCFERHPHVGRWSNDSIRGDDDVVIAPNCRWRVRLAEPRS